MKPITSFDSTETKVPVLVPETTEKFVNYIHIMRDLCARAMVQSIRFGDKSQTNTAQLKREIREGSKVSSELQVKIGKAAMWSGIFGLGLLVGQFAVSDQNIRGVVKWLAETGTQTASNMYSHYQTAQKSTTDALLAMRQTEYQAVSQKDPATTMQQNIQQLSDLSSSMYQKIASAG